MKRALWRAALMLTGLVAIQATTSSSQHFDPPTYETDPRRLILERFFEKRGSPIAHLSRDFLMAADRHRLDWRLLPSISVVESGGGKAYKNNNIFGWDNCDRYFPTIRDGIYLVASRLENSKFYKNKDLDAKLATYNPNPGYGALVKYVMRRIGPPQVDVFQTP